MLRPRTKTHWSYVITEVPTCPPMKEAMGQETGCMAMTDYWAGETNDYHFRPSGMCNNVTGEASVPRAYLKGQVSLG